MQLRPLCPHSRAQRAAAPPAMVPNPLRQGSYCYCHHLTFMAQSNKNGYRPHSEQTAKKTAPSVATNSQTRAHSKPEGGDNPLPPASLGTWVGWRRGVLPHIRDSWGCVLPGAVTQNIGFVFILSISKQLLARTSTQSEAILSLLDTLL